MEIIEVNKDVFETVIKIPMHVFQSVGFNELNKTKCDSLHYLLFKDRKYKLGIVFGVQNNIAKSPFSAPFGGFLPIVDDVKLRVLDVAVGILISWLKEKKYKAVEITLPPYCYHPSFISKQINCLWRFQFNTANIDLNYALDLACFTEKYIENLPRSARKNLKIGLKANLSFYKCETEVEKKQAYDLIVKNRLERGFPLHMTWSQVEATSKIIKSDFFLLKDSCGSYIASAIVFLVTTRIVQVIYWGDLSEFSNLKTMNVLSYRIFEYYKRKGLSILDVGPSTEKSIPNHGLAEFKESIGCEVSPKYKFRFEL